MSDSDRDSPAWLAGPALLVAVIGFALVAVCFAMPEAAFPLLAAAILGTLVHYVSGELSHFGYINLSFFLAVLVTLDADVALPFKPGLAPALQAAGAWGAGAAVLMLSMLGQLFNSSPRQSMAYWGCNGLRWIAVGGVLVGCRFLPLPELLVRAVPAVAGAMTYLVLDLTLVSSLMNSADDNDVQTWENIGRQNRLVLPGLIVLGSMADGLARASTSAAVGNAWVPLAVAGILGVPLALAIKGSVKGSIDELAMENQEELTNRLRKLEFEGQQRKEERDNLVDDVKRKTQELDTIYDLARSLGTSTNIDETINLVVSMIRRLRIPYQSCVIFLSKPGGGLEPKLPDTPYQEVLGMSGLLQLQEPFILQVLRDPRPYMNNEVSPSTSEQRIFKDERSVLVVPLMVSKENVGIIYLGSVNPKTHREEHLEKLKMLAAFAAPSIKTALLFEMKEKDFQSERQIREAVEAKNHQLNGLQKLGQAIGSSLKIENTFKVVAENLRQMVPGSQSVIVFGMSGSDGHLLKAEYISSPYSDFVRSLVVRNDEGILGKSTEQNRTILVTDSENYPLQNFINNERSVIVAPLKAEDEILGCLYVGAAKENSFTDEHRSLVETVSYQASIAVKNSRLYEQTQQMAFTDGLTGLYLHRFFQVRLTEEIAWADRYRKPICLVMVDTDHFKSFNDTLGHPAGDALLQEIAALLKDKVRNTDIVCRYGGDEFALILKDVPKEEAIKTCERIRETFQLRFAAHAVQVTASIGLACYPTDATNKKDLAKAADDALYVSKRNGRNRVTAAPTLEEKKDMPEIIQETLPR